MASGAAARGNAVGDLLAAMRPGQWTKNAVVAAAFFFALGDRSQRLDIVPDLLVTLAGVVLFCLTSGAVYIFNDLRDRESDRRHPEKRHRPIASGRLSVQRAWVGGTIVLAAAIAGSMALQPSFAMVVVGYVLLQMTYSVWLKQLPLLDIQIIAVGFVLRALAGAVLLDVTISPWLLLCAFLLALFLAVCKRRHERLDVGDGDASQRTTLLKYHPQLLDQITAIVSAATIVSYSIYTLSPKTVEKFGSSALGLTIPFVVFGIFRYLDLVYRHRLGDRPEKIVLTDLPLMADLAAYGVTVLLIFITCRVS